MELNRLFYLVSRVFFERIGKTYISRNFVLLPSKTFFSLVKYYFTKEVNRKIEYYL